MRCTIISAMVRTHQTQTLNREDPPVKATIIVTLAALFSTTAQAQTAQTLFRMAGYTVAGTRCAVYGEVASDPISDNKESTLYVRFCREGGSTELAIPVSNINQPSNLRRSGDIYYAYGRGGPESNGIDALSPRMARSESDLIKILDGIINDAAITFLSLTGSFTHTHTMVSLELDQDRTQSVSERMRNGQGILSVELSGSNMRSQECILNPEFRARRQDQTSLSESMEDLVQSCRLHGGERTREGFQPSINFQFQ